MANITVGGRDYDDAGLSLVHAMNIRGEPCMQIEAFPERGLDPHVLAYIPYPDKVSAAAGALRDAAQTALMCLTNEVFLALREPAAYEAAQLNRREARMKSAISELRAALIAAGALSAD